MPRKRPTTRPTAPALRAKPSRIDLAQIDPGTISTVERLDHVMGQVEDNLSAFTIEVKGQKISLPPRVGRLAIQALAEALHADALHIGAPAGTPHATEAGTDEDEADEDKTELTTTEAANLLNVSRPHLVKLLKEGTIPHHKVGSHHRVYRRDVLAYKKARRTQADSALRALTDQAQELDMGY